MDISLDAGNARIKWCVPSLNRYNDMLSAVYQLTKSDVQQVVGRRTTQGGYYCINGTWFAVGDMARKYQLKEKPEGAARYNETYYGAMLGASLAEAFSAYDQPVKDLNLFASYAPQDHRYSDVLEETVKRSWTVQSQYGTNIFRIKTVITGDEPLNGYAHYVFTNKGTEKKNNILRDAVTLVIDVGGHTADRAAIDKNGQIDGLSLDSVRVGTNEMIRQFERALRDRYLEEFQSVKNIDINRLEEAIRTGKFRMGKLELDCAEEAAAVINTLVNAVRDIIESAGGAANYDYILLTGGGSALIFEAIQVAMPIINFILAEPNLSLMKYANVFGGCKWLRLQRLVEEAKARRD